MKYHTAHNPEKKKRRSGTQAVVDQLRRLWSATHTTQDPVLYTRRWSPTAFPRSIAPSVS